MKSVAPPPPPQRHGQQLVSRTADPRSSQDKSSGGSVDTTKTRSGPQRVGMSSGKRPIGAAKGKEIDTEALCHPPPPQLEAPVRNMILQMHTPARTSQCRSRPAWTRSVHLDAPGQRHGQQLVSGTADPGVVRTSHPGAPLTQPKTHSDPQRVRMSRNITTFRLPIPALDPPCGERIMYPLPPPLVSVVCVLCLHSHAWHGCHPIGGWHKASVLGCLPLAAPIGLSLLVTPQVPPWCVCCCRGQGWVSCRVHMDQTFA